MRIKEVKTVLRLKLGQRTSSLFTEADGFRFFPEQHGVLAVHPDDGVAELIPWSQVERAPVELDEAERKKFLPAKGKAA